MIRMHIEQANATQPTKHRTNENHYSLRCEMCRELYYVDKHIIRRAYSALEGDPSNIPFSCEKCEIEFAEASYL
jgi:hypothetical protein